MKNGNLSSKENKFGLKHNGDLILSVGKSRKSKNWSIKKMLWSQLVYMISRTIRTDETVEEYGIMAKKDRDEKKDVGGFVGGKLIDGKRRKGNVEFRQLITLDADYVEGDIWESFKIKVGRAGAMYSTHSHTPRKPRMRIIIPLKRPVSPDEYGAISRKIAEDIGIDLFDSTTFEAHRLMYWPSTSRDGEFVFQYLDEPWLDPDNMLTRYRDWKDQSLWPEGTKAVGKRNAQMKRQMNPRDKKGFIGGFCKTYSVPMVIDKFLKDVYKPLIDGSRYTYIEGSTVGGLIVYDNGNFAYSHHGTDPASGVLCNSFDLVRIHKFGHLDKEYSEQNIKKRLPSFKAMLNFCKEDEKTKLTMMREKTREAREDFVNLSYDGTSGSEGGGVEETEWMSQLSMNDKGRLMGTFGNFLVILENAPELKDKIALNEFVHRPVILDDMPWRSIEDGENWQDWDDAELRGHMETVYGLTSPQKLNDAFLAVQGRNKFHPIKNYFETLIWDGKKRIETLFIDYLGAMDNEFTRKVTRKMLAAAVARIYQPGIKFDYILVLIGPQGIGKSYIIKKLGLNWHSDSVNTVQGKEAYEQLQGAWLIELAELSATRKADTEAVKHFISKQEDMYRVAYGKQVSVFPRQCVFFGTTNDNTFLRDKTGNRRFWPVKVGENKAKKSLWKDLNSEEIDQIWAEALYLYDNNEPLYLDNKLEQEAVLVQEFHTEESSLSGVIEQYVNMLLPENWKDLDIFERRQYINGSDFGSTRNGAVPRTRICAMEIWVEALNGDMKLLTPRQAREINEVISKIQGWKPYDKGAGKLRFGKLYGKQRAFIKTNVHSGE